MIDLETAEQIVLGTAGAGPGAVAVAAERDVLMAAGPDAASYLQGQISQNAEGLAVGGTSWTLLLQPRGKVDAWLRLHRLADERFLLDVDAGFGEAAKARLERFKLRVDVDITIATTSVLSIRGPGALPLADQAPSGLVALDASWGGIDGLDLIRLDADGSTVTTDSEPMDLSVVLQDAVATGSVLEASAELLDVIRVLQGMPTMGRELDESTIPAAARIVAQSVDFTKGCYVGQELVTRIHSRGSKTPTRLVGLRFARHSAPSVGSALLLDGASAGKVTSIAHSTGSGPIGLAYLKRAVEVPQTLEVQSGSGAAEPVDVFDLPSQAP